MRAVEIDAFGGIDVLEVRDVPAPEPAENEAVVELACAGVNYTDIYRRNGDYARSPTYPTPLPARIGVDGAGRVSAVGDGVSGVAVGDRVAFTRIQGSYAEYAAAPEAVVMPVPDGMELDVAAALITQGTTAHYLATSAWPLEAGHTCLVHAGAGGVGQLPDPDRPDPRGAGAGHGGIGGEGRNRRVAGRRRGHPLPRGGLSRSRDGRDRRRRRRRGLRLRRQGDVPRLPSVPAAARPLRPVRPRLGQGGQPRPPGPVGGRFRLLHPAPHGPLHPHAGRVRRPLAGPGRLGVGRPAHRGHRPRPAPRPGGRGPPDHGGPRVPAASCCCGPAGTAPVRSRPEPPQSSAASSWRWTPRPSTPSSITSPGARNLGGLKPAPTPGGVPVDTISPVRNDIMALR